MSTYTVSSVFAFSCWLATELLSTQYHIIHFVDPRCEHKYQRCVQSLWKLWSGVFKKVRRSNLEERKNPGKASHQDEDLLKRYGCGFALQCFVSCSSCLFMCIPDSSYSQHKEDCVEWYGKSNWYFKEKQICSSATFSTLLNTAIVKRNRVRLVKNNTHDNKSVKPTHCNP